MSSATTVPQLEWTPHRGRYDCYDTSDFVAVGETARLKVGTANVAAPITVSGDLTGAGTGSVQLDINAPVTLRLAASNPEGVMQPRTEVVRIVTQLPAQNVDLSKLEPGVAWGLYAGRVDLENLTMIGDPEVWTSGGKRIKLQSLTKLKQLDKGTAESITDAKPLGRNQSLVFEGYLKVPADGKYTFYTRTAGGCRLTLDGVLVTDAPNFERDEEFVSEIYLAKGLHAIRFDFGHSWETGLFHLKWSGPGIEKQVIPAVALFHKPKAVAGP